LDRSRAIRGEDHPATLLTMNVLAVACQGAGKLDRAVQLYEQLLPLMRAKYAADYPPTLTAMFNLAGAYRAAGKIDRALSLYEQVLARRKSILGPDHPDTFASMSGLAAAYWSAKRLDRSIPLFEESLKLRLAKEGHDQPETLIDKANLGVNYSDAGRSAEALPLLEEAAKARGRVPVLRNIRTSLLDAYVRAGQTEKAANLASELLAEGRAALSAGSLPLAGLLASTGMVRLQVRAWNEAEPVLRECLAIRQKAEPDAWTTFNTKSMLGGALLGQRKYADAEPLLRAGFDGMKSRAAKIPPQARIRLREALDRLIDLAEAANNRDDATKWTHEKAKLPAESMPPKTRTEK
jgi:tetratricopeptide (TPR) repeat protein